MSKDVVSFHQGHEFLLKLEQAGLTPTLAQRLITWPANALARAWVKSLLDQMVDWLCDACEGRGVVPAPPNLTNVAWVRCRAPNCPGPPANWIGGYKPLRRSKDGTIVPEGVHPANLPLASVVEEVATELRMIGNKLSVTLSTRERLHSLATRLNVTAATAMLRKPEEPPAQEGTGAPPCYACGGKMQPAGSVYVCTSCGNTVGG
ncbi:MAG TPA: hypothetical protein VJA63_00645 [Candidatus Paceibacterota bacterium]